MCAIHFRKMISNDIYNITKVRTMVRENHMSVEEMAALGITPQLIRNMIEKYPCGYVALVKNEIVGFSLADLTTATIFALFIAPNFEGKGIGSRLLKLAEVFLFNYHDQIALTTRAKTRADAFYRKHGYEEKSRDALHDILFIKNRPSGFITDGL